MRKRLPLRVRIIGLWLEARFTGGLDALKPEYRGFRQFYRLMLGHNQRTSV